MYTSEIKRKVWFTPCNEIIMRNVFRTFSVFDKKRLYGAFSVHTFREFTWNFRRFAVLMHLGTSSGCFQMLYMSNMFGLITD